MLRGSITMAQIQTSEQKQTLIELYDLGRCTHRAVPGMYEFIVQHAGRYVSDQGLATELADHAANREKPGYSVPQTHFTQMCGIWVAAYHDGSWRPDLSKVVFADTAPRFQRVKSAGRNVGILTSGSGAFTELLYDVPLVGGGNLKDLVDEYILGEVIGDKDHPETFGQLWEIRKGGIHAVYDDKVSVCEAVVNGFKQAGGSSRIYLVDRKRSYDTATGELAERVSALLGQGVQKIKTFDEVRD